ncbi:basic salivary proline-rich protein 2-like [Perognathus longimembris pacificus]|uniref:basic salivary proline-rich protein 2-like n=1 Tax=Perognathus longimembris pacificus TaxID=214514 RepID=UPI002018DB59|nr:basic salivary proline-rich protein 2-like [Perognathus longimembris pacificus]
MAPGRPAPRASVHRPGRLRRQAAGRWPPARRPHGSRSAGQGRAREDPEAASGSPHQASKHQDQRTKLRPGRPRGPPSASQLRPSPGVPPPPDGCRGAGETDRVLRSPFPPRATPGSNRFSPEPKLGRSFTPCASRARGSEPPARRGAVSGSRGPSPGVAAAAAAAGARAGRTQTKPGGPAQRPAPRWWRPRRPADLPGRCAPGTAEDGGAGPEPRAEAERGERGARRATAPAALSVRPPPPLPPRRPPAPREGARRRLHPPPPAPRAPSFLLGSRLPVSSAAAARRWGRGGRRDALRRTAPPAPGSGTGSLPLGRSREECARPAAAAQKGGPS